MYNFQGRKQWAHEEQWQVHLWRCLRWIHGVSSFISLSVSARMSWLFYDQDVLCQPRGLPLFCQASGSKPLNWTAPAPHILRELLLSCFILTFLSTVGFVIRLTNKATSIHYKQKQALTPLKWFVCVSSEGAHQKNGESDSWSSSWSGPLIRSEWQENMGPNRYLPPDPAPYLLLPYGH